MKAFSRLLAFFLVLLLGMITTDLNAQSNWEVGGRFGDKFSLDITVPFAAPRLHPSFYFSNHFGAGVYFDWLFAIENDPTGLKFYPGVGPELWFGNGLDVAAAGDFGIEYSFDFPLTIGVDWRPRVMLTDQMDFNGANWGFMARFRIGEGTRFVKVD